MKWTNLLFSAIVLSGMQVVNAATSLTVPMNLVDAKGASKSIGTIKIEKGHCGVLLTPDLHDLPPGTHGFHVHENPSCDNAALAAGGHLDPAHTTKHRGPYENDGHLGDLPVLVVNQEGRATSPMLAPRFTMADLKDHALVIHAGSDNYSDTPEKLGGGGARIACGVISEN